MGFIRRRSRDCARDDGGVWSTERTVVVEDDVVTTGVDLELPVVDGQAISGCNFDAIFSG